MRPRFRLQGWFWDAGPLFLPLLRRLRLAASLLLYRLRSRSRSLPPRIVSEAHGRRGFPPLQPPLIAVHASAGSDRDAVERFLAAQTETSVTTDPAVAEGATFSLTMSDEPEPLPPTWLESQLLAMVAEDLEFTVCGWATLRLSPSGAATTDPYTFRPPAAVVADTAETPCPGLVRLPTTGARQPPPVLGRAVPHVTAETPPIRPSPGESPRDLGPIPHAGRSGPYFLRSDVGPGRIVRHRLRSLHDALGRLPVEPGLPTVLFLLPFLAVGGAESLLFDLLAGLKERYRLLVVTVEPHRAELGQTVDEARALTPHVYTLGDWLPRPAHHDALRHLIRRWAVEVLVSWNGTVFFYDVAPRLRRSHPRLRIVNQLFNHRGGWIEHYGPRLVASTDLHVAVNQAIDRALRDQRGVPDERRLVIHHGVRLPDEISSEVRAERRRRARRELDLPQDAVIVGSFMRMHPQKRPFDVISLAERAHGHASPVCPPPGELHFLLAGGGPLDREIDRALARQAHPNLTRLPLRRDVDRLYDAVDLCLLTSAYEGLPVFLLDALARGIPCVATAVGDIPYLLRDGGGILVERVGDLDALDAALHQLRDARRRATEGDLGRATVARRFGVERYVRAYEAAFFPPSPER